MGSLLFKWNLCILLFYKVISLDTSDVGWKQRVSISKIEVKLILDTKRFFYFFIWALNITRNNVQASGTDAPVGALLPYGSSPRSRSLTYIRVE